MSIIAASYSPGFGREMYDFEKFVTREDYFCGHTFDSK